MTTIPREEDWLKQLSGEVMESLSQARSDGQSLSVEVLAKKLGEREGVKALLQEACQQILPEVAEDQKDQDQEREKQELELKFKEIQQKYNKAVEDIRRTDRKHEELQNTFKRLIVVLTALSDAPNQPELTEELKKLREQLKNKPNTTQLDQRTKNLKEILYHMEHDAPPAKAEKKGGLWRNIFGGGDRVDVKSDQPLTPSPTPEPQAEPEGVEETIRDILVILLRDLSEFEDETIQDKSKDLIKKIRRQLSLDDFKPYVEEIRDLILHLKGIVLKEKRELLRFTQEIVSQLEDTEKVFLQTLEQDSGRLGNREREFERQVDGDMRAIEQSFNADDADFDQVRSLVLAKIVQIRDRFRKKRAEDEARLKQIQEEKAGVEKRLAGMHERYQHFAEQTQATLAEMEKFKQASLKDQLTGAYNRRAYDFQLEQALTSLKNGKLANLSLIVFDIDHFKDFNNNYGHRAGDKILRHVNKYAASSVRKQDIVCRYGGDEFTVILPEVNLDNAAGVAEKIRRSLADVEFKIYRDKDLTVRIGLSMGVAAGRKSDDAGSIFQRADQALYLAKEKGRNQVRSEKELD